MPCDQPQRTALWTEVCLAFPSLDAMREGYEDQTKPAPNKTTGPPPSTSYTAARRDGGALPVPALCINWRATCGSGSKSGAGVHPALAAPLLRQCIASGPANHRDRVTIAHRLAATIVACTTSPVAPRYDTKLWMRDLMEGAAYLPK